MSKMHCIRHLKFANFFAERVAIKMHCRTSIQLAITSGFVVFVTNFAQAESLSSLIPELLKTNNLVKASEAVAAAANEQIRVSEGGWLPTLGVTGIYGHEKQKKPEGTDDTDYAARSVDLSVTQLLWDFGNVNSQIRTSQIGLTRAEADLELRRQEVTLRGVSAFLNLRRAHETLMFARESENNIKRQTELEDALVKRGAGLSTDVLQSKRQLASAQSRRVQAEGQLALARNEYRAIFLNEVADPRKLKKPILPLELVPPTLSDALDIALRENPSLRVAVADTGLARESVNTTRSSSFFPKIDAIGESKYKKDSGGTSGEQRELIAKLQMTFNFNLGMTAVNSLKAAENAVTSSSKTEAFQRETVEQRVRNAWDNLLINRTNFKILRNETAIAAEFLDLVRKERQLGNRQLQDVLQGETALINANSSATAAETDIAIGVYELLAAMGRLSLEAIRD